MKEHRTVKIVRSDGPFWSYSLNLGVGHCGRCVYCYNGFRTWYQDDMRGYELLGFEKYLRAWRPKAGSENTSQVVTPFFVMMCSQGDPFHPTLEFSARVVLNSLLGSRLWGHLRVLTKMGPSEYDIGGDWRVGGTLFGASLTTCDPQVWRLMQPLARSRQYLMEYLGDAHDAGCPVWVSSEPMLEGMDLRSLAGDLEDSQDVVPSEWWVGRLNYGNAVISAYALPEDEIVRQFAEASASFPKVEWHLKADVIPVGHPADCEVVV